MGYSGFLIYRGPGLSGFFAISIYVGFTNHLRTSPSSKFVQMYTYIVFRVHCKYNLNS